MIGAAPLSVEVSRLYKSFRIPVQRIETLKERAIRPFQRPEFRELRVLHDISFQVRQGEFFGIVGRNGSGKSTLLKLMASVYRPDAGRIRVSGSVAPIIELGVGFQPELTALDNVILNSLMMGLTPKEARRRFDAVIEFAELQDFLGLKLKNYSSGMRVRLAFATMMQSDPDVMILDEVLAVGDAPFQRRCRQTFDDLKSKGAKTVLMVTHSMANLNDYCDRAMLLEDGRIEQIGDPGEISKSYLELEPMSEIAREEPPERELAPARVEHVEFLDGAGNPTRTLERGQSLLVRASCRATKPLDSPRLLLEISDGQGTTIFAPPEIDLGSMAPALANGEVVDVRARIENRFPAGRYWVACAVAAGPPGLTAAVSEAASIPFDVAPNGNGEAGLISLDYDVSLNPTMAPTEERR
jgi:ABC-2 type transport system ATP-binding protein